MQTNESTSQFHCPNTLCSLHEIQKLQQSCQPHNSNANQWVYQPIATCPNILCQSKKHHCHVPKNTSATLPASKGPRSSSSPVSHTITMQMPRWHIAMHKVVAHSWAYCSRRQIPCHHIVLLQLVSQGVFEFGVKLPSSHKNLRTCCRTTQGTCNLHQLQIQQFWLPSHFLNKYVPKHFCVPAWGIKGSQEAQHIGHQLFRDLPVSAMWTHPLVERFSLALPAFWWRATLIATCQANKACGDPLLFSFDPLPSSSHSWRLGGVEPTHTSTGSSALTQAMTSCNSSTK